MVKMSVPKTLTYVLAFNTARAGGKNVWRH